jgi:hypothetical protein
MSGLAVTLALYRHGRVHVSILDPAPPGMSFGASSVAAGLLHPLSPRGTLTWRGREGLNATMQLVREAQAQLNVPSSSANSGGGSERRPQAKRVVACERILRPALAGDHKGAFTPGNDGLFKDGSSGRPHMVWLGAAELERELGLALPKCDGAAAIEGGCVVDTKLYLKGLWASCQAKGAEWVQTEVSSLAELLPVSTAREGPRGSAPRSALPSANSSGSATPASSAAQSSRSGPTDPGFDAVVVCAGAGLRFLPELRYLCEDGTVSFSRGRSVEFSLVSPEASAQAGAGTFQDHAANSNAEAGEDCGGGVVGGSSGGGGGGDGGVGRAWPSQRWPPSALLCGEYVVPVGDRLVLGATHERIPFDEPGPDFDFDPILGNSANPNPSPHPNPNPTLGNLATGPLTPAASTGAHRSSLQEVLALGLYEAATLLWPPLLGHLDGHQEGQRHGTAVAGVATSAAPPAPSAAAPSVMVRATVGVRVLPRRSHHGKLPVVGRVRGLPRGWLLTGLGSRGLIHHAHLAEIVAKALLADDDSAIPPEVRLSHKQVEREPAGASSS